MTERADGGSDAAGPEKVRAPHDLAPLPWFIDEGQTGIGGKDTLAICHSGDLELATPPIVCVVYRGYEDGPSWELANRICVTINAAASRRKAPAPQRKDR